MRPVSLGLFPGGAKRAGTSVPVDDPPNYARSFDGIDDEFTHVDAAAFDFGSGVSFEWDGWFKPTNFANYRGLITKGRNAYDMYVNITDGKVNAALKDLESSFVSVSSTNAAIADAWNHISLFCDLANDLMGIVLNGVTDTAAFTSAGVITDTNPFSLGSLGAQFYMLGAMSRWRLWKGRVNSAAQRTWLATPRRHVSLTTVVDGIPMNTGLTLSYDLEEEV